MKDKEKKKKDRKDKKEKKSDKQLKLKNVDVDSFCLDDVLKLVMKKRKKASIDDEQFGMFATEVDSDNEEYYLFDSMIDSIESENAISPELLHKDKSTGEVNYIIDINV